MENFDVVTARLGVIDWFKEMGLVARDFQETEFSGGGPIVGGGVRFKIGTRHQELSLIVYRGKDHLATIRVTNPGQMPGLRAEVEKIWSDHQ